MVNFKKVLIIGICLWTLIFFCTNFISFLLLFEKGLFYYILYAFLITFFSILGALYYFSNYRGGWDWNWFVGNEEINAGWKEGLILGIGFVSISLILYSPIIIFVKDWKFFISPEMIINYFCMTIISILVGMFRKTHPPKKRPIVKYFGKENSNLI